METYMQLTKLEQAIIDTAIKLLEPHNTETESYNSTYFREIDGDEVSNEYDCCDNDECIQKTLNELKTNKFYKKKKIEAVFSSNDGDHENIERCYQCNKPLNDSLTWVAYDFEHYQEHVTTKQDIIEPNHVFDIIAILSSMPSADYRLSAHANHQALLGNNKPREQAINRQDNFVKRVVDYAELIINQLL